MSGIAPARVPQVAVLTSPPYQVYVTTAADLPSPVTGVITLLANTEYIIGPGVDLAGSRIVAGANCAIRGVYAELSSLTSTGLGSTVALIQGAVRFQMRDLTIKDVGKALALDTTDGSSPLTLEWRNINFSNVPNMGTIANYANVLISVLGILSGSERLSFEGSIGTVALDNVFADLTTAPGVDAALIFDTLTITRRIRIERSAFIVPTGATGIRVDVGGDLTIPDEQFILDLVNFAGTGGASAYVDGANGQTGASLWASCTGIVNTRFSALMTMQGNAIVTTISVVDTPVKVAGATVDTTSDGWAVSTSNRVTYTGAATRAHAVDAVVTTVGVDSYTVYIAVNGAIVDYTGVSIDGSNQGPINAAPMLHLAAVGTGDYIEVWIENNTDTSDVTISKLSLRVIAIG